MLNREVVLDPALVHESAFLEELLQDHLDLVTVAEETEDDAETVRTAKGTVLLH